jgi:hypothetical protein
VVTRISRNRAPNARRIARSAANPRYVNPLARAGLIARGVMYVIIGWIAIQIAFGHSGHQADQSGATRLVASTPVGTAALWLLVAGFAGLTLWRLSEAVYGGPGPDGRKVSTRAAAAFRVAVYGFLAFSLLKFALGLGAPPSSDKASRDLTSAAMSHPGGVAVVSLAGVALIAGGVFLAYQAWQKEFLEDLRLAEMTPRTRRVVGVLGRVGGIARGTVFAAIGGFLFFAVVHSSPGQAKGIDATLRTLAATPVGPWLLAVVALGLVMFGAYSIADSRWRQL